ncbi:MAG: hypothetical protein KIT14_07895 [bacterium]|nr:hypothetical protein [bacterium]
MVLLGAGHAHLPVLAAPVLARREVALVCVAPGPFHYSGLATGMLGGGAPLGAEAVDVAPLVARLGGRLVSGEAVAIDRAAGRVVLAAGPPLPFDLVSLDVGSVVPASAVAGGEHAAAVKPLAMLGRLRRGLEARLAAGAVPRVAIVGGGLAGCGSRRTSRQLARRRGRAAITLVARSARLAPASLPEGAARALAAVLRAGRGRGRVGGPRRPSSRVRCTRRAAARSPATSASSPPAWCRHRSPPARASRSTRTARW